MEQKNEIPEKLLELIASKDFKALSLEEKSLVLRFLEHSEYDLLRESHCLMLSAMGKTTENIEPNAADEATLKERFKKKHKQPGAKIYRILNFNVPLWQAAAVFLLFFSFFSLKGQKSELTGIPVLSTVTDTIYLAVRDTIEIVKKDTVYVAREKQSAHNLIAKKQMMAEQAHTLNEKENGPEPVEETQSGTSLKKAIGSFGKSLREDSIAGSFGFVAL